MKEMTMDADEMGRLERHGQAVKRIRSLCDMHRVPFGDVKDLGELIASIREDRHFAMDFWALIGDLSARERGTLSDEEMLDVIVEAATGAGAASVPHGHRIRVEELRQLLAGVDVGRPADLPDAIAEPEDALLNGLRNGQRTTGPGTPVVVLPERTAGTMRVGARVRLAGNDDALVARRSIGEALSRLERTSTELREQLAAIDEQLDVELSKAEPEDAEKQQVAAQEEAGNLEGVEEVKARESLPESLKAPQEPVIAPKQSAWRRSAASAKVIRREAEIGGERQDEKRGAEVFPPRPPHTLSQRGLAIPEEDDDPSIVAPLSSYARESDGRAKHRITGPAVLLALVAGGLFFFTRTEAGHTALAKMSPTLREQYEGLTERLSVLKREATTRRDDGQSSGNSSAARSENAPATPAAPVATVPKAVSPANAPSASPATNPANANPEPNATSEESAAGVVTGEASPKAGSTARIEPKDRRYHEAAVGRSRIAEAPSEPAGEGLVEDAQAIKVSSAVMEAHLAASRVPAYPETAKAGGIEGRVVMEAVISKSGTVDHVRVIEGDRHLRSAAEEAVLKWRYRPYLVNGRPVDVATVVRVDFRLRGYNRR